MPQSSALLPSILICLYRLCRANYSGSDLQEPFEGLSGLVQPFPLLELFSRRCAYIGGAGDGGGHRH